MRNEFGYLGKSRCGGMSFGDPGSVPDDEQKMCGVCGAICLVTRGHNGPTSWAESVAGRGHPHDTFACPYYGLEWHRRATKLINEMRGTESKRLRALIEADLDELVDDSLNTCSNCGTVFDIVYEQICPNCGKEECASYKPWRSGCNSKEPCSHKSTCKWVKRS